MIAMKFTIELDIGLSFLLQAALPQLVTDRETKPHRRGRSKRSYGHCRRRTEIPEAEPSAGHLAGPLIGRGGFPQDLPAKPPGEGPLNVRGGRGAGRRYLWRVLYELGVACLRYRHGRHPSWA